MLCGFCINRWIFEPLIAVYISTKLALYDVNRNRIIGRTTGHTNGVSQVIGFPGAVLSAAKDKTVRLWDVGSDYSQPLQSRGGAAIFLTTNTQRLQILPLK